MPDEDMNAADEALWSLDDIDSSLVAAVVIDDEGLIVRATAAAAEMLGFALERLVGRRLGELTADGWHGAADNALARIQSGAGDAFELLLIGRSGRRSLIRMIPRRTLHSTHAIGHVLFWRRLSFALEPPPESPQTMTRRLTYGLLRKHDDHRSRISGELRHDVASLITVAKLTVESAAGQLQRGQLQEASSLLFNTSERLRETLANVRRISTDLKPSSLDDLGLTATIEWLCRQLKEAYPDLRIELQLDIEESSIGPALKIDLFRIIEESLVNVARHAHASRARLTMLATRAQIQMIIEDDGYGFDVAPFLRGDTDFRGLGLHSIGSRIEATHGSLRVESMPGTGTSIVATWLVDDATANPR